MIKEYLASQRLKLQRAFGFKAYEYEVKPTSDSVVGEIGAIIKDLGAAFLMALIVIQFVIQAFKIPTGSMEESLLVGDFLLGLKFVYGSPIPFTYKKLPGIKEPQRQDVVIFKYPGDPNYPDAKNPNNENGQFVKIINTFIMGTLYWDKSVGEFTFFMPKDFIKRCVAVGGDTVEIKEKKLFINNAVVELAKEGKYSDYNVYPANMDPRDNFGPVVIPKKGNTYIIDSLSIREFFWMRSLIYQENPTKNLLTNMEFWVNDSLVVSHTQKGSLYDRRTGNDWYYVEQNLAYLKEKNDSSIVRINFDLSLDNKNLDSYTLQKNAYFMMGDNRDNSLDSRYWGPVSRTFVNAKAFIIYWSWDSAALLFNKARLSRVGKLIL